MLTLAFDTSSNILSTALLLDNKIIDQDVILENGKQAELLVPQIEKILKKNNIWYPDLQLIATTNGPGSFTGVRIGLVTARIIKLATNLPLILVNSNEAIAYKYKNKSGKIFSIIDARMEEFFCAEFLAKNEILSVTQEPQLLGPQQLSNFFPDNNFFICGSGKKLAEKFLSQKNYETSNEEDLLKADLIGCLAYKKFCDGKISVNFDPLYLRDPKIEMRKK